MSFKLMDNVNVDDTNNINLPELSTEEMVQSTVDQNAIDSEILAIANVISVSRETVNNLESALAIAELASESEDLNPREVVNLNIAINAAAVNVGLESFMDDLSVESITDPKEALKLSIEEGRSLVTKIIGAINKTFARYNNVLNKYIGKFNTLLSSIGTNLVKRKAALEELNKSGKKLTDATIADDTFFKWNGYSMLGAVGIGKMKDPVAGVNEMISAYGKPTYVKDFSDKILSMVRDDKKLTPIYNNPEAMKAIERNLGKKIKNFFCKSTPDDRMIIGATYNNVFILERCKALHITSKINRWSYSILTTTLPISANGTPTSFDTPKYSDLIKLIDSGIEIIKKRNEVVKNIHDMLKIGSDTIKEIDDSANWENSNIYGVLPGVLLVLSKTYAEIPNMVDGLASIYIKELKKV